METVVGLPCYAARRRWGNRCGIGTADDVATAVRYLLGDEASFITGAVLRVDGGRIWS